MAAEAESCVRWLVRAPGRVNLIGCHTDYNEGFVLPVAIDRCVDMAFSPSGGDIRISSTTFGSDAAFSLRAIAREGKNCKNCKNCKNWSDYVKAVARRLIMEGYALKGIKGRLASDIPSGAGLGSSAALEIAIGTALIARNDLAIEPLELVKLCVRAENDLGVQCGIMDQFTSEFGVRGCALFLDCRTLEYEPIALPDDLKIVILNSGVTRELASTLYNERRRECAQAVSAIRRRREIGALRDLSVDEFEELAAELPATLRRRCRHVVYENGRVLRARDALLSGHIDQVGELMYGSHQSLRDDYEVSCCELDKLVEIARSVEGVVGSRLTGAGFGGCTVNLVWEEAVGDLIRAVEEKAAYVCGAADGASLRRLTKPSL